MQEVIQARNIFEQVLPSEARKKLREVMQNTVSKSEEEMWEFKVNSFNKEQKPPDEATGYDCKICGNKRLIMRYENGYDTCSPCVCEKIIAMLKELRKSGIRKAGTYTFERYIASAGWQVNIKALAEEFVGQNETKWFYIGGQSGSGKSHICTAMVLELIKQGKKAKYAVWDRAVKELNAVVNDENYAEVFDDYANAEVLYIDDFLKPVGSDRRVNDGELRRGFELINARYNSEGITIISSERTISELVEIDEATAGRICEMADIYAIEIGKDKTKNYRLQRN